MKKFLFLLLFACSMEAIADEVNALCISGGDIPSYESGQTIEFGNIPYYSRVSLKALEPREKRFAMFLIPLNYTPEGEWEHFELKASTNNFWWASPEDVRLQYYSQSEIADTGAKKGVGGYGTDMDKMWMFVCTRFHNDGPGFYGNQRSYFYITNTLPRVGWTNQMTTISVIVDTSCLIRHPDGDWLKEDDVDLMWCWHKYYYTGENTVRETEKNTTAALWRPIAPIRWFDEMPNWAKEQIPTNNLEVIQIHENQ